MSSRLPNGESVDMCSGCNGDYSELRKQERFKYLDNEQVIILLLHELIDTVKGLQTA